ncbi:hypothetical protein [Desulfobacter sp.]|uniref:hypothetical protein n=1 Tax=Desulfobacter sp. TaxID=2294 RepID=UPI000E887198|nr:hypothetical protein [Desulfobacter sp.]HBT87323.1 hypothetical protein [Desulfobacter sp.]
MKTKKWKRWAAIILGPPLILIAIHINFNVGLQKVVHAENSVNPDATNSFSHATLIGDYIDRIHDTFFIDYDSILFTPLYKLETYFFKKGQKSIQPDNLGEEGVWWFLVYGERYGFCKQGREDESLLITNLPPKKSWEIRMQVYNYFLAITDGRIKGIKFGKPVSDSAHNFFQVVFIKICDLYPWEIDGEWIEECWDDRSLFEKQLTLYRRFKNYIRTDPFLDTHKLVQNNMHVRLEHLIYHYLLENNTTNACGKLLDDYLQILGNDNYRRQLIANSEKPSIRIEEVNIVLKKAGQLCTGKKKRILDIQKKYN